MDVTEADIENPYYAAVINILFEATFFENSIADYELLMTAAVVAGIIVGAIVSASLADAAQVSWVPALWAATFGDNPLWRQLGALIGGICIGLGARWAGGCTSGHGISGTLQLVLSSWLATACFFIGGIAVAFLLYHGVAR